MLEMGKDYYTILGVSKSATQEDIKKAFKKKAAKYHPDRNPGDKTSEDKFKDLNEAYQVLGSPEKRKQYDTGGVSFENMQFDPDLLKDLGFDFGDIRFTGKGGLDNLIDILSGGGGRRKTGTDLYLKTEVTLEEAATGLKKGISYHVGSCPTCKGGGYQTAEFVQGGARVRQAVTCGRCYGEGQAAIEGGKENINVTIPPGIEDGNKLKLSGRGLEGGDLFIDVKVKPHDIYTREGDDLYVNASLSITEAVFGAELEVQSLGGVKKVKIPKGVQPGAKMRLKGKGMPNRKTQAKGDLYVVLQVDIPKSLTEEQEKAFKELEKIL